MANWDKLDKEFYEVVDKLTDEQWVSWRKQQHHNQLIRRFQKEMAMKIHLLKLSFFETQGHSVFRKSNMEEIEFSKMGSFKIANDPQKIAPKDNLLYCLAA
jgi:hypothetical protein